MMEASPHAAAFPAHTARPFAATLSQFAEQCGFRVVREGGFSFTGKLSTDLPDRLTPLAAGKYLPELGRASGVSAVIASPDLADRLDGPYGVAVSDDVQESFALLHEDFHRLREAEQGAPATRIGAGCDIHPSACVAEKGVWIGDGVSIGANATVEPGSVIADGAYVGQCCAIGCEGFQTSVIGGRRRLLRQVGGVFLGENAVILANSTIARATFGGFTEVHAEAMIDAQVQIGHDAIVGKGAQIASGAVLCGRAIIGDATYVAPGAIVSNGVSVGAKARLSIGAVVIEDVRDGQTVTGNFAMDHRLFMKDYAKKAFM